MPESTFAQSVDAWHDFYVVAGTVGATLMGLLFVAVSLRLDTIADPTRPDLRSRANNGYEQFLYIVLFSLMFLIPDQSRSGLGIPLLAISAVRLLSLRQELRRVWATGRGRLVDRRSAIWRFVVPAVCYAAVLVVSGGLLLVDWTGGLYWLVGVVTVLLANAAQNAWNLLLAVGFSERDV
jgi:hypothetical protein